ncbi:MAG: T9SS type A sorting domain-containing protein, partial [Bacteroidota bacterium]
AAISLLTISSIHALAQRPEDMRVSPPDISNFRVPIQGRFQSAAAIKEKTLVAWGTSRRTPDDSLAYTIRYQIFNGSSPAIIDRPLTLDRARPFGFTIVMPVERAFLVLWNDNRKDSSGIYMQRIAENGDFRSGETRIGKGIISPDSSVGIWGLPNRAGGSLLLWRDGSDGNLHGIKLDLNGQLTDSEHVIAENIDRILTFDSLPGTYMLMNHQNGIIVDDHGNIDSRTIPPANLNVPFFIDRDTSLLLIQGGTLRYYHSIFDSIPYKILAVATVDSGVPGMTAIRKGSNGIQIFFGRVSVTGTQTSLGKIIVQFHRIDIFPGDSISAPVSVINDQSSNGSSTYSGDSYSISVFNGASSREGCSSTYRFKLGWTGVGYIHGHAQPESQFETYYSIGRDGVALKSDSAFISDGYTAWQNRSIKRLDDTTASSVSIILAGKNIVLHATSALLTTVVARTNPGLVVSNNTLVVTWEEPGKAFECRRWSPETGNPSQAISRLHISDIQESYSIGMRSIQKTLTHTDDLYNWPGMSGIKSIQRIEDYGIYYYTGASYGYERLSWGRVSFFMATDNGWSKSISLDDNFISPPFAAQHSINGLFNGYDPSSNQIFMRVWNNVADRSSPVTFLSAGLNGSGWRIEGLDTMLKYGLPPLQAGDHRFMLYGDSTASVYSGNAFSNQFRFSTVRPSFCLKSLGPQFIRLSWTDNISANLHIELYDFDGNHLKSQIIPRKTKDQFPLFFQNPRDSSWALYWIADNSIHITLLGNDLSVIVPDTIISSHGMKKNVSAVVRGDTVYAVWEDYRNGNADIYGNYLSIPRHTASVNHQNIPAVRSSKDNIEQPIVSIFPNPAHDVINIDIATKMSDGADIAIINMLGEVIRSVHHDAEPSWRQRFSIVTEGIPAGAYLLRYRSGNITESELITIKP